MGTREDRIKAAMGKYLYRNDPDEIAKRRRERLKKKPKARSCPLESWEHIQFAQVLRKLGLFFIHVPNEGKRSQREGQRLRNMGLRRGCPDFIIFDRPPVAIEMKRVKGSKVAPEQIEFLEELNRHGWRTFITYGHEAAIEALKVCGHLKDVRDEARRIGRDVQERETSSEPRLREIGALDEGK